MSVQRRNHYDEAFKLQAVKSYAEGKLTLTESASRLGITSGMLSKWVKQYPIEKSGNSNQVNFETEIRQLKLEMNALKEEMIILKGLVSRCLIEKFDSIIE